MPEGTRQEASVLVRGLERDDLVRIAIPGIARKFEATREEVMALLNQRNGSLTELVARFQESAVRSSVNQWWNRYKGEFPSFGLVELQRAPSPSKLPDVVYQQLICLMVVSKDLEQRAFDARGVRRREENRIREQERRLAETVKPPTWWERFKMALGRMFGGGGR